MDPMICLAIAEKTVYDAIAVAKKFVEKVDLIEIRLDSLQSPEIGPFMKSIPCQLLFTNRPSWEGGSWHGDEHDRVALLLEAIEQGAAFVDIELSAPQASQQKVFTKAKGSLTKVISSSHNFQETPGNEILADLLAQQIASGADIAKMVTTAHNSLDTLRVLALQQQATQANFPLAAFSMGEAGKISRLATLSLGGLMTYVAGDKESCTAPNQIAIDDYLAIMELMK